MALTTHVYALFDPRTGEMRYVGFARDVARRVRDHISCSDKSNTYRANWLRSLRDAGLRPEYEVIETVAVDDVQDAERFWIAYYRMIGCPLTNLSAGGDGAYGWRMPAEVKAKLAARARGRLATPETRAKMSAAHRGRPAWWNVGKHWTAAQRDLLTVQRRAYARSDERRAPVSAQFRGRPQSPEHRAHIAETQRGRHHSAETRARMSASQTLRWQRTRKESYR